MRTAALMRLARVLRKQRQLREAFASYHELASMGETMVAGSPAGLVARRERIMLLNTIGEKDAAPHETAELALRCRKADSASIDPRSISIEKPLLPHPRQRIARTAIAFVSRMRWRRFGR